MVNLFDFTQSSTTQPTAIDFINRIPTTNKTQQSYINPQVQQKTTWFSLIPKANAETPNYNNDDIKKFRDLLSKGIEPERAKTLIQQAKWISPIIKQPQQPIQQQNKWFLESITYKPYTQEEMASSATPWEALTKYWKNVVWWAYNILPWVAKLTTWLAKWVAKDMYNQMWSLFWLDTTQYNKEQKQKTDQLIKWLAQHYTTTYWSKEWLVNALQTDPVSIISDVLTVAWVWLAWKWKLSNVQKTALETQKQNIINQVRNATTLEQKSALIKQWIEKSKQIVSKWAEVEKYMKWAWTVLKYDPYVAVPKLWTKLATSWVKLPWKIVWWVTKPVTNQLKTLFSKPNEIQGIQQAIRPYLKTKNWVVIRWQKQVEKEIARTNELIKLAGDKPTDLATYKQAIDKQLKNLWSKIEAKTKQPLEIDLTDTAWKIRELANTKTVWLLDKWEWQKLLDIADNIEKWWKISVSEAEFMNQWINDVVKSTWTASETYKKWLTILVKDIRAKLDDTLSSIPWEFKQIKTDYGALRNILWDTVKREIIYNRQNPEWLITSFSKIEWLSNVWSWLLKILWLDVKWWVSDIWKWLIQNKIWTFIKTKNDPNYIINQIFNKKFKNVITKPNISNISKTSNMNTSNLNNTFNTKSNTIKPIFSPKEKAKIEWLKVKAPTITPKTSTKIDKTVKVWENVSNTTNKTNMKPYSNKKWFINPSAMKESLVEGNKQIYNGIEYPKEIYHWTSKEIRWPLKWWYFTPDLEYAKTYQQTTASSIPKSKDFYSSPNNPWIYKTNLNPKEVFDIRKPEDLKIFNKYLETDSVSWPWYWVSKKWLVDWTEWEYLKMFLDEQYPWKYKFVALDEWWIPWLKWKVEDRGISFAPINPEEIQIQKIWNKSGFINPSQIWKDIKAGIEKVKRVIVNPNVAKARTEYERLVKSWVKPLEAQKRMVDKYKVSWVKFKAWSIWVWDDIVKQESAIKNFDKRTLINLLKQTRNTWKLPLREEISKWFINNVPLLERSKKIEEVKRFLRDKIDLLEDIVKPIIYTKQNIVKKPLTKAETYWMWHRPTKTWAIWSDITKWWELLPNDFYTKPDYYFSMKDKSYKESFDVISKIKWNPNAEITIYRAWIKDEFNPWDWITLSKTYAKEHMERNNLKWIYTKKVKAKDIQYAWDDINEFWYYPNTKSPIIKPKKIK